MGKNPRRHLCEDGVVVTPDFAAVIDGSTSKGNLRLEGKTTGQTAMELLSRAVADLLDAEDDMPEAIQKFTECLQKTYEKYNILDEAVRHPANRLTASMVIYSGRRKEVWMLGDCLCRFNGVTHLHPKPTDALLAGIRADILRYLLQKGHSIADLQERDLGREWILPALKDPVLCDTLEASENELHRRLAADPLFIANPPATKGLMKGNESFDDRAYLRIALTP